MLNHILVVFDTLTYSDYLLARAGSIAHAFGAMITLVYVLEVGADRNRVQGVDPLDWHLRKKEAQANLDMLAQRLRDTAVRVETDLLEHAEATIIINFAQAHQVDLIVLTKQTEGINDFVHNLTRFATMPILILQPRGYLMSDTQEEPCFRKILVPLDSSQRAEYALPFAASLAYSCRAKLLVAHVVQRPQLFDRHLPPDAEEAELAEAIVTHHRNEAMKYLEQLTTQLAGDVQIRLFVHDNVAASLHQLVRDERVDLIVLSAHGQSGEPQRPYGSIAASLITYNTKPVLLVQDLPRDWKELLAEPVAVRKVR